MLQFEVPLGLECESEEGIDLSTVRACRCEYKIKLLRIILLIIIIWFYKTLSYKVICIFSFNYPDNFFLFHLKMVRNLNKSTTGNRNFTRKNGPNNVMFYFLGICLLALFFPKAMQLNRFLPHSFLLLHF